MKVFVSQVNGGVATIKSKNKKTAAKALNVPEHQFFWQETNDPLLIKLAEKDRMTVISPENDSTKQEETSTETI
jgi:hypothetical protein